VLEVRGFDICRSGNVWCSLRRWVCRRDTAILLQLNPGFGSIPSGGLGPPETGSRTYYLTGFTSSTGITPSVRLAKGKTYRCNCTHRARGPRQAVSSVQQVTVPDTYYALAS
jgi:hypothetical protein